MCLNAATPQCGIVVRTTIRRFVAEKTGALMVLKVNVFVCMSNVPREGVLPAQQERQAVKEGELFLRHQWCITEPWRVVPHATLHLVFLVPWLIAFLGYWYLAL